MEELFNKQENIIKKLLKEAPMETPSKDFSKKVMQHIEKKNIYMPYRPLISKTAWLGIAALFIVGLVWVYYNPSSSAYNLDTRSLSEKVNLKNPFEGLHFSKTTLYAIGFMALFILQVPVLKRIVEKKFV